MGVFGFQNRRNWLSFSLMKRAANGDIQRVNDLIKLGQRKVLRIRPPIPVHIHISNSMG